MTLRAGLSGCGAMGRAAVLQVRGHDHCDIVAVHDPDPEAVRTMRERHGIGFGTTSFDELLSSGVDFVVLAGPPGVRLDQVQRAAEQAVPCLLHAPMAIDEAQANAMLAAADAAAMKLGVAVPGQGDPLFDQVRRMVAGDWFGGIVMIQGTAGDDDLLRTPPDAGNWRLQPELAGSDPLLRLASAHVHLATWLSGRSAVQVTAQVSRGFLSLPADTAVATALLRGGGLCSFAASHLTNVRAFSVHGTDGGIRIAGERIWVCGRKAYQGDLFDYAGNDEELVLARSDLGTRFVERGRALELHGRFARWLDDRDDFPCPGEQAVADLRTLWAMARAAANGRTETV